MIRYKTINETGEKLADRIRREEPQFEGEAIVFVGALGICVRKILPKVCDKHTDPAVICIDTTGQYVIPVLSGHIGGANSLARDIARIIGAKEIITTQSDNCCLWALDTLPQRFGWRMGEMAREESNRAIATFVNKKPTALAVEHEDDGTRYLEGSLPDHVTLFHSYSDYLSCGSDFELLIIVSPYIRTTGDTPCIQYFPPCLCLGVGCQRHADNGCGAHVGRHKEPWLRHGEHTFDRKHHAEEGRVHATTLEPAHAMGETRHPRGRQTGRRGSGQPVGKGV